MQSLNHRDAGSHAAGCLRHGADMYLRLVAERLPLQVMKFAIATRVKAMAFLSSVAVVGGLDHPQDVMEDEVGTRLCTEHPGDGGYAVGYPPSSAATGCSKNELRHPQCLVSLFLQSWIILSFAGGMNSQGHSGKMGAIKNAGPC